MQIPPPPPYGTGDFRFIDPRGYSSTCMDQGLYIDIRPFIDSVQIDTYEVQFEPPTTGHPIVLRWIDLPAHYSGPVKLVDLFGGIVVNVDMKAQTEATISLPIGYLYIIAQGPINPISSRSISTMTTSAYVGGSFNARGLPTEGWFEWGDSTSYGQATSHQSIGNGYAEVDFSDTLQDLLPNKKYHFRAVTQNSSGIFYGVDQAIMTSVSTDAGIPTTVPTAYDVGQNYPNPFNPSTTIRYALPERDYVNISVYNLLGQKVGELVDEIQSPGMHSAKFNAEHLPSGVYFYRLVAGKFSVVKKMVFLR